MSNENFNYYILAFCAFICCFMYLDSYFAPLKSIKDIVVNKKYYEQNVENTRRRTFELEMERNDFDVTATAYNSIRDNDTITIEKSKLTSSIQKIVVTNDLSGSIYQVGFIRARSGRIYTPMLCLFVLLSIIFNSKLTKRKDKNYTPYFSLVISLILLSLHLGLEYYFK